MNVQQKVIVVTGAGSGMGRELTRLLLAKDAEVAMADVNLAGMEETAQMVGAKEKDLSMTKLDVSDRKQVEAFPQ